MPDDAPANIGYTAAEHHFSEARLNPELLMIESDHDMRNPSDMLILERVAKAVLHAPGVALVQSVTRPLGTPIKHSSIPFQISAQSAGQVMNLSYQGDRARDLLTQIDQTGKAIDILQRQLSLQQQATDATDEHRSTQRECNFHLGQHRDLLGQSSVIATSMPRVVTSPPVGCSAPS